MTIETSKRLIAYLSQQYDAAEDALYKARENYANALATEVVEGLKAKYPGSLFRIWANHGFLGLDAYSFTDQKFKSLDDCWKWEDENTSVPMFVLDGFIESCWDELQAFDESVKLGSFEVGDVKP
jgi:hypothetical protein